MKQKVLEKMAAQDAYDYGVAQMFFGEGAGTRRKLLDAVIGDKMRDIPGYETAFETAASRLNQTELAEIAIKQRKKLDAAAKAGKNFRALKNGNINGLSTGLFIIVGGVMIARRTGYDKVIEAEAKKIWTLVKSDYRVRKAQFQKENDK